MLQSINCTEYDEYKMCVRPVTAVTATHAAFDGDSSVVKQLVIRCKYSSARSNVQSRQVTES